MRTLMILASLTATARHMSDDNVKPLPVRPKDHNQVLKLADSYGGCQHRRAIVDEKLAELTCADCQAKLNPIQFLVTIYHRLRLFEHEKRSIAAARAELERRKRCRCTQCGEWTEIRTVHNYELARIKGSREQTEP